MLGVQGVVHKIETSYGKTSGGVDLDVGFLQTNDIHAVFVCYGLNELSLGG
jgi:hypothetical protein